MAASPCRLLSSRKLIIAEALLMKSVLQILTVAALSLLFGGDRGRAALQSPQPLTGKPVGINFEVAG